MENILEKVRNISEYVDTENAHVNVTNALLEEIVSLASAYDHWLYGETAMMLSDVANYKTMFLSISDKEIELTYDTNKEAVNEKEHLLLCSCYKYIKKVEISRGCVHLETRKGVSVKKPDNINSMVIFFNGLPDYLREQLVDTLLKTEE